jgi:hypothetical protein
MFAANPPGFDVGFSGAVFESQQGRSEARTEARAGSKLTVKMRLPARHGLRVSAGLTLTRLQ